MKTTKFIFICGMHWKWEILAIWTIFIMRWMLFYCVKLLKIDFNWGKINMVLTLGKAILQVPWVGLYIKGDLSKIIISLPTNSEHLEFFEKTLTEGFSYVNTLAYHLIQKFCYKTSKIQIRTIGRIIVKVSYNIKLDV